ncbi:7278_t:CDS:2 [Rhizophagus irregularis]|nr:7278_t:CDS:2 [Rhizophagus irregularis]
MQENIQEKGNKEDVNNTTTNTKQYINNRQDDPMITDEDIAEITTTMNKVTIQDELHIKDSIDTTKTTNNLETAEETMEEITTEDQMRTTPEIAETTKLNKYITIRHWIQITTHNSRQ